MKGEVCKIGFARRIFTALICRQSGADSVYCENSPDGTYSTYFPFGELRDMAKVRRYHGKCRQMPGNYSSSGSRNSLIPAATSRLNQAIAFLISETCTRSRS